MAIDLRNKLECTYLEDSSTWKQSFGQALDRVSVRLDAHPALLDFV